MWATMIMLMQLCFKRHYGIHNNVYYGCYYIVIIHCNVYSNRVGRITMYMYYVIV